MNYRKAPSIEVRHQLRLAGLNNSPTQAHGGRMRKRHYRSKPISWRQRFCDFVNMGLKPAGQPNYREKLSAKHRRLLENVRRPLTVNSPEVGAQALEVAKAMQALRNTKSSTILRMKNKL